MMPCVTRGLFVVIEGLDRSGKTTQAAALLERLTSSEGVPAKLLKIPGTCDTTSYEPAL
jgi:dTMP kinase